MSNSAKPVIIKKVKKGHHGAHGGAWKVAYADFVTAMMAFFLLMWLLGSTESDYRKGIAEYFQDPTGAQQSGGKSVGDSASLIEGGGEDLTRDDGQVKLAQESSVEVDTKSVQGEPQNIEQNLAEKLPAEKEEKNTADSPEKKDRDKPLPEDELQKQLEEQEKIKLEELKEKLEQILEQNPILVQFKDQLRIDITPEGLRIQIIDKENRPMFSLAKANLEAYAAYILEQIAGSINALPNRLSVAGHTDARPYAGGQGGYSNWELSADRANAARRQLVKSGLEPSKVIRVVGLADSLPFDPKIDPKDSTNRRISIIVLNKRTENTILHGGEPQMNVTKEEVKNSGFPAPGKP